MSRDEARRPDVMTAELKKGFEWSAQHSQALGLVVGALFLIGAGWSLMNYLNERKETALQEKFSAAEKTYLDKKEKFEQFQKSSAQPADPKSKVAPKVEGEKASGDLNQDYGTVVTDLEALVKEAPSSKAAVLSALTLTRIYDGYQKKNESIEVLKKVQSASGLLGVLAQSELGSELANNGDCKGAIDLWAKVVKDSDAKFMSPQLKLKMGLCSESLGQKAQAEDSYKQVVAEAKDSAAGKSAEKYLRLLESKDAP